MVDPARIELLRARIAELERIEATHNQLLQESRMREQEWHLFSLATTNMLWNWDFSTNLVERNLAFETAFGYTTEEVDPAIDWWVDRLHPEDKKRVLAAFQATCDSDKRRCSYTYRFRRVDDSYADIDDNVFILRDSNGEAVRALGAMTDITDQARLETEARRLASLESLGLLAGGIAHDFNNMIMGVSSLTSTLAELLEDDIPKQKIAFRAGEFAEAMTSLVGQLMTFSKGGVPIRRVTDLGELAKTSSRLALSGSSVAATYDLAPERVLVNADPTQLSQVVHNLVLNAVQAMNGKGQVRITVHEARHDAVPDALGHGRWVRLAVADRGPGIAESVRERLFEISVTTKPNGHGLGLAVVDSIIRRHGGHVSVNSEPNRGTTVEVFLPLVIASVVERVTGPPSVCRSGSGTVLVMDDQAVVLEVVTLMLGVLGYEVVTAQHGEEAVNRFRKAQEESEPIDVVIVDLTVPGGMGGIDTRHAIRQMDADVPIIVSSGYSDDPIVARHNEHGFAAGLRKPFTIDDLADVLATVAPAGRRGR